MRGKVSKRTVDALRPGMQDVFLWDSEIPGFGVRVKPSGHKGYLYKFRFKGRPQWYAIGLHGAPWTPERARDEAKRLAGRVADGANPADERRAERATATVRELAARFLAEHSETKNKARTFAEYRRLVDKLILPHLGRLRLDALTRADVARFHHDLRETPYQANRALAVLSKMMNWTERHGLRPDGSNPCRHVEKFKERARERFLSEAELARLGDGLAEAESEWRAHQGAVVEARKRGEKPPKPTRDLVSPTATAAVRLLVFTGARLSEVLTLRWEHVDFERAMLLLPDSKTGAKPVYLAPPALEVLKAQPRVEGNSYVLPGQKEGAFLVNLEKPWRDLRSRAGLDDVRLHDLRHSFASVAAGMGQSLVVIGRLLGHTQAQTTRRYAHLAADPVRQAADAVGKRIADAMQGPRAAAKSAGVVSIQR